MKTTTSTSLRKHKYEKPEANRIKIDNEISLVLQSQSPPSDPWTSSNFQQENNDMNNPFKTDNV